MTLTKLVTGMCISLKRRLTTLPAPPADRPRWFVNYALEYFANDSKYAKWFAVSRSQSGVLVCRYDDDNFPKMQEILNRFSGLKTKDELIQFDDDCVKLLMKNFQLSSAVSLLSVWYSLAGGAVFNTTFYKSIVHLWKCETCRSDVSGLVVMLYFLGQTKKYPLDLIEAIQKRIEELCNELSYDEWTLVCHNFFVMNVTLSPTIIRQVTNATIRSLPNANSMQLIANLKALRHSRHSIEDLLPPLSDYILRTYRDYTFLECAHFLATYANANSYNRDVFTSIEKHIFDKPLLEILPRPFYQDLKNLHPHVRVRSKDVARFLWVMAHTRHNLTSSNLEQLLVILCRKVFEGDFVNNPQHLIDSLQSLIFYNNYPQNLLAYALSGSFVKNCIDIGKAKPCHQLFFISCSIEIECPSYSGPKVSKELLSKLRHYLKRVVSKDLVAREGLQEMLTLVKNYYGVGGDKVKCLSLLPHIPIVGVVIKQIQGSVELTSFDLMDLKAFTRDLHLNDFISFEVFDSSLSIGKRPNGLLATKIRQMEKLGCRVVTLSTAAVIELSQLQQVDLKKEMDRLIIGN